MSSAPASTPATTPPPPPTEAPKPANPEPLQPSKESQDPEKGRVKTPQPGKSEHPTQ
jgi:hypothetical protein